MTANNAELYAWPIDLEQSRITLSAGELVTVNIADYKITDPKLVPGELLKRAIFCHFQDLIECQDV